jgi:hypothetical protein
MAKFGKDKDAIFQDCQGVIGTHFSTFSAKSALIFHYFWDRKRNLLALNNFGPEEEMGIGFFHIAVQELSGLIFLQG